MTNQVWLQCIQIELGTGPSVLSVYLPSKISSFFYIYFSEMNALSPAVVGCLETGNSVRCLSYLYVHRDVFVSCICLLIGQRGSSVHQQREEEEFLPIDITSVAKIVLKMRPLWSQNRYLLRRF
ncbi:hypothetical protein L9F63_019009, partial [Diploptera punctata]